MANDPSDLQRRVHSAGIAYYRVDGRMASFHALALWKSQYGAAGLHRPGGPLFGLETCCRAGVEHSLLYNWRDHGFLRSALPGSEFATVAFQ